MRSTRLITAEFLGVFLIGSLVGGLAVRNLTDTTLNQFMSKTNDPDSVIVARVTDRYAKEYHLTDDELNRIKPLIKDMAHHVSQVRREFGLDIMNTMDAYHAKISQELAPEHREAYEKAMVERKKQLTNMLQINSTTPSQEAN